MKKKIITVGRQFGSNGREIGKRIAARFDIPFYDKELLTKAAKASGLSENLLKNLDEKPNKSFLYNLVMDPYNYGYSNSGYQMNLSQQAFQATYDTIKSIANEGPCVIVGRCADYALRHNEKLFRTFIFAPMDERIKTIANRFNINEDKAKILISKEDKARASYYNYYTSQKWGALESYDLFVNSSLLSIDDTVDYIVSYIEKINK